MVQPNARKRNRKKLQSAMEYLTTYGWALLVIAVVLVSLFRLGIFSSTTFTSRAQPGSCQVSRPGGPYSNYLVSLQGVCTGQLPQYVAQFNGQSSYVDAGQPSGLSLITPFTLQVWIKRGTIASTGQIITKDWNYKLYIDSNNKISVQFRDQVGSAWRTLLSSSSVSATWTSVAATLEPTGSNTLVKIYLNGILDTSNTLVGQPNAFSTNFRIGENQAGTESFNGQITNAQIYNTSLSTNEIQVQYIRGMGGAPIRPQNIIGWWPLNGDVNDYSGNGNSGTPTNVVYIKS